MPVRYDRLQSGAVVIFIDKSALHSRIHTTPGPPRGVKRRDSHRTLSSAPVHRFGI